MASTGQRSGQIEHGARLGDDLGAAGRVEALAARGPTLVGNGVGAIKRVIETSPAGVGRVERVAGIRHGHDQLRSGDPSNFGIDVSCRDRASWRFRQQIANFAQKRLILRGIMRLSGMRPVPGVDLELQGVAMGQQVASFG